jgi:DUF1680 family protein
MLSPTIKSPVLNPILYSLIGRRFQRDLQKSFPCCVGDKMQSGTSVATHERNATSIGVTSTCTLDNKESIRLTS